MLSISKEVLLAEIDLAKRIMTKWEGQLTAGIPQVDTPGDEQSFDAFVKEMVGEFQVIASKFDGLANIMSDDSSSG